MISASLLSTLALATQPQDVGGDVVTLAFGWPAEGSVRVREEILKKGRNAKATYLLRWEPAGDGSGTVVEYTEFELLEIEGLDRSDPRVAPALLQAEAMAAAIPRLVIDAEGYLTAFVGFDEAIEAVLGLFSERDEQLAARMGVALRQPQVRQAVEASTAETWNAWVGQWIGVEVERGTEEIWELDLEATGSVFPKMEVRYGTLAEHRGLECVQIELAAVADEELLLRTTLEMLGVIGEDLGEELVPDDLPITRMARTDRIAGTYAVDGLRPLEVERSETIRVWEKGAGGPQEQVERHRYVFEWADLTTVEEDD